MLHCFSEAYILPKLTERTSAFSKRLDRFSFVGFLGMLAFAPILFGAPQAMYWWPTQVAIQLVTVAVAALVLLLHHPLPYGVRGARVSIGLLLFILAYVGFQIVAGISISVHDTLVQWIKTLCLLQVFVLTLILVRDRARLILLVTVLVYSGAFQALYGLVMLLTGMDYIWHLPKEVGQGLVTGTFVNRNHLAGYLEMTIALGIGLMISRLDRGRANSWRQWLRGWTEALLSQKVLLRLCLILMVIALILTRSRMGNTAFMVSLGVTALIGVLVFRRTSRPVVILFISILVIDVVILGSVVGIEKLTERFQQSGSIAVQINERALVPTLSLEQVKLTPWFGTGLGTWYASFPQHRIYSISADFRYAHNDYIQFLSELGVVGWMPLALIVVLSLTQACRILLKSRSVTYRSLSLGMIMAVIAILIHSWADFNLQLFPNAITFVVILALPFTIELGEHQVKR